MDFDSKILESDMIDDIINRFSNNLEKTEITFAGNPQEPDEFGMKDEYEFKSVTCRLSNVMSYR